MVLGRFTVEAGRPAWLAECSHSICEAPCFFTSSSALYTLGMELARHYKPSTWG